MRHAKYAWIAVFVLAVSCVAICVWLFFPRQSSDNSPFVPAVPTQGLQEQVLAPRRIFFVNSYHEGYPWSDGIFSGFVRALEMRPKTEEGFWESPEYILQVYYLNSKRNSSEDNKIAAAAEALSLLERWQPDLVVASDDNAVKYLLLPLLQSNHSLPVVYCGVNWDASEYHLPRSQVTGMIEVQPIDQLVATLLPFAHGSRVGFLKGKDFSASKEFDAIENFLGISLQCRLVVDFAEWLRSYEELQRNCDVLLLGNPVSIRDWDAARAREVIAERTRIPTGAWDAWMREYALVTFATDPAEQGIWAAAAAKAILAGRSPAEIPVVRNRKAKIFRNMAMAKQLGVVFPMEFIRQSWAVERNISK